MRGRLFEKSPSHPASTVKNTGEGVVFSISCLCRCFLSFLFCVFEGAIRESLPFLFVPQNSLNLHFTHFSFNAIIKLRFIEIRRAYGGRMHFYITNT